MAGLLPIVTSFAEPRLHLGYRRIDCWRRRRWASRGPTFRGHEFHYAQLVERGAAPRLFEVADATDRSLGQAGAQVGNVAGSFLHLIDRPPEDDAVGRVTCAW